MHLFKNISAPVCIRSYLVRVLGDDLGQSPGIDKLEDNTVSIAALNDIIRDRCGDPELKRFLCQCALPVKHGLRYIGLIHLNYCLFIDTVHGSVPALADQVASFNIDPSQALAYIEKIGKAGHVEDVVHIVRHISDRYTLIASLTRLKQDS